MAQQSLKNLDSFSRGYIEDVRSNVDFDTTLRSTFYNTSALENVTSINLEAIPTSVIDGSIPDENINPIIGKVISGVGITGTPRVTEISEDRLTITFDQPQSILANTERTILTFSDTNSGIDRYELTGSAKRRSKEDIRIDSLVPEQLLDHVSNNDSGGIRTFLESYYKFMNLEEFSYKDEEIFEDVVIDNIATFRINNPNKFFQKNLILAAEFRDSDGVRLLVGDVDGTPSLSGDALLLDDTSRLTVGSSYQITDLGNGTATNIATGINNISGQENESYSVGDLFVATDVGTAYDATRGSTPVSVRLLVYPTVTDDIFTRNVSISNSNKLPGRLSSTREPTGRTVTLSNLPPQLNKRKITMKTFVYNYVDSGPSYRLNTIEDSLNLNEAEEEFLDMMQKEIAPALDKTSPVNKRAVYEKIIDFYKVRGSFESIETFFKLLYNEQEVQVEYPWDNTLKPSAGTYDAKGAIASNYQETGTVAASDEANDDRFGFSISVSGNSFAVGAPRADAHGASAGNDGAVYVYTTTNDGGTYTEEQLIRSTASGGTNTGDQLGKCVDLDGDTLAISSPTDEGTAGVANTGSVEVWTRSKNISGNNVWNFNALIEPTATGQLFASGNESISLSGNYLAISHRNLASTSDVPSGGVHIYLRSGTSWSLLQTIRAPVGFNTLHPSNNNFGETVVLKGQYLVASFQNFSTSSIRKTGRVFVYKKSEITSLYELDAILAPSNDRVNQEFGYAIDITNVENGTPRIALTSKDTPYHTVYVFERGNEVDGVGVWTAINSLPSFETPAARDQTNYGSIVRISGDNLVIGEPGYDGSGNENNGRVIHYEYDQDTLIWQKKLEYYGDTTTAGIEFGFGLDISDDGKNYLIIGAPSNNVTGLGKVRSYNRPARAGLYSTSAGFLSEKNIKLHDSDLYQKFSYIVKVGRNLSQWKEPFNKLVHPAGFKYFADVLLVLQAVRNVLGDNNRDTTIGIGDDTQVYLDSFSASPAFRKTLSSMPGVQPGYVGVEDLGLILEALASSFGIIGIAKRNKDAKLAITSVASNGAITGISIAERGHGYASAPTISITGGGSSGTATCTINDKGEVNSVTITGAGTGYDTQDAATPQTLAQVSNSGSLNQIGKTSSTSLGLFLIGLNNKSYTSTPTITISAPDARDSQGALLATNVQATATLTRNSTTGKITGFTITNPGNGYLNDASIIVQSVVEKRAPDYVHKKIIPSNHDVNIVSVLPRNGYFARKEKLPTTKYTVTVASKSDNTGNAFYINGVQAPSLALIRGNTYQFLQDDSTNNTHLIKFSTLPNGTHGGGFEYTLGVKYFGTPGTSGAYTEITIPKDAPDLLYYYCLNHSGMGFNLNISGTGAGKSNMLDDGNKKFNSNYPINLFSDIAIQDIGNTTSDGTLINKLNTQTSLKDAIKETTL